VDGAGIFETGLATGYEVPPEYMPRFGRQDIPYYIDTTGAGTGTFLVGLNHLFTDSTADAERQFNVVGGEDNTGVPGVSSIRLQTGTSSGLVYGEWDTLLGSIDAYQGRLYSDDSVISSDVGPGLKGIQFPPFLGPARIYGVYDRRDFINAGGTTYNTSRTALESGAPPNLLRTDADKQTLFIIQGGAEDVTGNANDHTYVIPENAIDIELSDSYTPGETFTDLEYVVECVVFGFSRGFINQNNYVIARLHNGSGASPEDLLSGARMTIPAAAPINNQCYIAYDRTVYQGDPYMTRAGATRTVSDYEHRYGQIEVTDAYDATNAIQQYDSNGDQVPQTINERALEVLASVDFWTTLGTGKVGGNLFPGTSLDVGFTQENTDDATFTRLPAESSSPPFQAGTRAFTEGQKATLSRGSAGIRIDNNAGINPGDAVIIETPSRVVALVTPANWAVGAASPDTAQNIVTAINQNAFASIWVIAWSVGEAIYIDAREGGDSGDSVFVRITNSSAMSILVPRPQTLYPGLLTGTHLLEGVDKPMNAGDDVSPTPIKLTGMTERLPLGLLLQDADFVGEAPLRDGSSYLRSSYGTLSAGGLLPVPLSEGEEFTGIVGGEGAIIGMSDGAILQYTPYHETISPTGSRRFRLFRGGGSSYVISGEHPGGPVDWAGGSLDLSRDVLKGAILVGRAFLVRNYAEEAFTGSERTSHGDELQMVIVTNGVLGRGSPAFLSPATTERRMRLAGMVSPTGYGEGYAAADRYRLEGKPLYAGHSRKAPDLDPELAPFPFASIAANAGETEE
jgi:hypothetical protein